MINLLKKYKYAVVAATFSLTLASCEPPEDTNINPNEPSQPAPAFLLTSAQKTLMDGIWDEWLNGRRGMQLSQYWSSNQYSDESRYAFRSSISNNYWSSYYAGVIADLDDIIRLNTESEEYAGFGDPQNQIAVAKVMRVYMYQMITDMWGAIPYSQAGKPDEFLYPAYDSQEEVYNGLLAEIDEAIALINVSAKGVSGDVIYSGDMSKWAKFANSVKLKLAMRMADAAPSVAQQAASAAVSAGVMQSNADNALFAYLAAAPNNNPLNEDRKTRADFAASNILIDELLMLDDPRIEVYAEPTVTSVASGNPEYIGEVYGLEEATAAQTVNDIVSQPSEEVLSATAPGIFMQYAEVQFFLAEAVERGFISSGSAESFYNEGVRASMSYWGITDASAVSAYLAQPSVSYTALKSSGEEWNTIIGQQKWLALYMQGLESWAEYRRLDFGILKPPAEGALEGDGDVPLRITYPLSEQSSNGSNYSEAVAGQGADLLETRLWWDVR